MLHLIKYGFYQTVREWSSMFWALAFPIILGTLFYLSFGQWSLEEHMEAMPVAVVREETGEDAKAFLAYLEELEGDMVVAETVTEEQALDLLSSDKVEGIFYVRETPSLTVAKSGLEQSILKALLDTYEKNAQTIKAVARSHPEGMKAALETLEDWHGMTREVSVGGRTLDSNITYFFALIAFAALSGVYLGIKNSCDSQANLSALGARRCITPTHKLKIVSCNFIVLFIIQFLNIMILTVYLRFVLGIDLGNHPGELVLVNLLGSMIGVSMGILIGSIGRMQFGMKMGLGVLFTLFPGFLAGLMFGNVKNLIEQHCPVINRINPAAVLSDSYYCMAVFDDARRMRGNLLLLGVMSLLCVAGAVLVVRRKQYDSI